MPVASSTVAARMLYRSAAGTRSTSGGRSAFLIADPFSRDTPCCSWRKRGVRRVKGQKFREFCGDRFDPPGTHTRPRRAREVTRRLGLRCLPVDDQLAAAAEPLEMPPQDVLDPSERFLVGCLGDQDDNAVAGADTADAGAEPCAGGG